MATLTVRKGYWILNYSDDTGRHRISLGSVDAVPKREAEAVRLAKEYELSTGARLLRVGHPPAPTLGRFCADYLLWHRTEYPDSHYRVDQILQQHILPRFHLTPLNLIKVADVEQWKTERRFRVRASSVAKELRVFNAVLNRAVELGLVQANPIAAVKAPQQLDSKPHHWYSVQALAALYAAASPQHAPIWKLLANTGLRRGEAQMLRWAWVGEQSIKILSTEAERTKDGEWREIPVTDGAREALKAIPRTGDYVLPRIAPPSLSRAFARDVEASGVGGSLHSLRHTYVCHLLLQGVPIRTAQLYAGHAHISTTERYAYQVLPNAPTAVLRLAL